MIQMQSILDVADNSGARKIAVIFSHRWAKREAMGRLNRRTRISYK